MARRFAWGHETGARTPSQTYRRTRLDTYDTDSVVRMNERAYVLGLYRRLLRAAQAMPTAQRTSTVRNRVRSEFWANRTAPRASDVAGGKDETNNPPEGTREFHWLCAEEHLDQLEIMAGHLNALKRMDDRGVGGGTLIPVDISEGSEPTHHNCGNHNHNHRHSHNGGEPPSPSPPSVSKTLQSRWGRWDTPEAEKLALNQRLKRDKQSLENDKTEFRAAVRRKLASIRDSRPGQ